MHYTACGKTKMYPCSSSIARIRFLNDMEICRFIINLFSLQLQYKDSSNFFFWRFNENYSFPRRHIGLISVCGLTPRFSYFLRKFYWLRILNFTSIVKIKKIFYLKRQISRNIILMKWSLYAGQLLASSSGILGS